MSNKERFIEIVDIEKTIKYVIIFLAIFGFAMVGLTLLFKDREYAGETGLSFILLLAIWTDIVFKKLANRRKYLYRQLHDNGLSYLEINETIDKLKGES